LVFVLVFALGFFLGFGIGTFFGFGVGVGLGEVGGPNAACPKSKQSSIPSDATSLALIAFNPNVTSQNLTKLTCE
jgi:hypothetical protein